MNVNKEKQASAVVTRRGQSRLKWILALLAFFGIASVSATPPPAAASMPASDRAKIERQLTEQVQARINTQKRIEGQSKNVVAKVRFDNASKRVIVDLSRGYVPRHAGGQLEDLERELRTEIEELLMGVVDFSGVEFRYDGRSIQDFHPDPPKSRAPKAARLNANNLVAISAGHGYYYHHGQNAWVAQREPGAGGLLEDTITPLYATHLQGMLSVHSVVNTAYLRATGGAPHPQSGYPWWHMASRYFLQEMYPGLPHIWNSKAGETYPLREYDEDINSRPFYANHINATTFITVHTNGSDIPSARGTRVYYQQGRTDSADLADSVLCYMREAIQGQPTYKDFPVAQSTLTGNYGELRNADMPGVLVEVAFHSNAEDAVALQDTLFRVASMGGVEKGYRMHRDGIGCEPFKLVSVPNVSGTYSHSLEVLFHYTGHPRFPLFLQTEIIECPAGWSCRGKQWSYNVYKPSPLAFNFTCGSHPTQDSATFKWRTTLRDADGIVTSAIDHTTTCSR